MVVKGFIRKVLFIFIFSLIYLAIGVLVAILISKNSDNNIQDIMTYEGLILVVIGILMSMKGNPSGISISGMGQKNAGMIAYMNNEITRQDSARNPYYKDYFKNNVVEFAFSNLSLIFSGIFMLAICLFVL